MTPRTRSVLAGVFCLLSVTVGIGCQSSFERYFVPAEVGLTLPAIDEPQVEIIETGEQDTQLIRERLYPDAMLLGTASFTGPGESTDALRRFAASIGSNLAIWRAGYIDTIVYTDYDRIHGTETATITTRDGEARTVTRIEADHVDVVPRTVVRDRYHHEVLYLRR